MIATAMTTSPTLVGSVDYCYSTGPLNLSQCDACPCCRDTCANEKSCIACQNKQITSSSSSSIPVLNSNWLAGAFTSICRESNENNRDSTYTMCQLKRHNHADSAWILVGDTIYDATPYIRSHPGGMQTILKKSGGAADCTEDLRFHSGRAQREWRKFKVGTLVPCSRQSS